MISMGAAAGCRRSVGAAKEVDVPFRLPLGVGFGVPLADRGICGIDRVDRQSRTRRRSPRSGIQGNRYATLTNGRGDPLRGTRCSRYVPAMPAKAPSGNPFRNPRLAEQARSGMLLTVKCTGCGRFARFWAKDLVEVLGPDHQAHIPPFPCARCRTKEWINWSWSVPSAPELAAGLTVRRPVRKVTRWIWRNEDA